MTELLGMHKIALEHRTHIVAPTDNSLPAHYRTGGQTPPSSSQGYFPNQTGTSTPPSHPNKSQRGKVTLPLPSGSFFSSLEKRRDFSKQSLMSVSVSVSMKMNQKRFVE